MGRKIRAALPAIALMSVPAVTSADTVFTNLTEWQAAATQRGPVSLLTLNPSAVPDTGATVVDDELTLVFPENHGDIATFDHGWVGDVHDSPGPHSPGPTLVTFARPVWAFSASTWVGIDLAPEYDSIIVDIGDTSHRLMAADYPSGSPGFFGWVGDAPVESLTVRSGAASHFYGVLDVQYVAVAPAGAQSQGANVVPLPAAALGRAVAAGRSGVRALAPGAPGALGAGLIRRWRQRPAGRPRPSRRDGGVVSRRQAAGR